MTVFVNIWDNDACEYVVVEQFNGDSIPRVGEWVRLKLNDIERWFIVDRVVWSFPGPLSTRVDIVICEPECEDDNDSEEGQIDIVDDR